MRDQRDPQTLGLRIFKLRDKYNISILEAADRLDTELIKQPQTPSPAQVECRIPAPASGLLSSPGPWPEGRPRRLFEEDGA